MSIPSLLLRTCALTFAVGVADELHDPAFFRGVHDTTVSLIAGAHITATPTSLERSGNWVSVSWSGIPHASASDWVALFDATANYTTNAPLKYKMVSEGITVDHKPSIGSGSYYAEFRLIDVRAPLRFVYMQGGFVKPVVVAESGAVVFANSASPQQLHLGLTGRSREMRASFIAGMDCTAPHFEWAPCDIDPAEAWTTTAATWFTYGPEALCAAPATTVGWRDPGMLVTAVLEPLAPNMCYQYRALCGKSPSQTFRFRGPPLPGDSARPFSFALIVDLGQSEIDDSYVLEGKSQAAAETVSKLTASSGVEVPNGEAAIDFVLLPGDIAYARGHAYQWDNFGHMIEPLAARVPWMMGLGNHERDAPNSGVPFDGGSSGSGGCRGECGVPAELRYPMPGAVLPESGGRALAVKGGIPKESWKWYSFDHATVHVVMISTEHDIGANSSQFQWLARDLRGVDRNVTPWMVLAGHRPMYDDTSSKADWDVAEQLQLGLEDLLVETGVDFALWGHTHNAQRTCKVRRGQCVDGSGGSRAVLRSGQAGVVHLVAGHAGYHTSLGTHDPRPPWVEWISLGTHGFCRANVLSAVKLQLECIDNANGFVVDTVTLVKGDGLGYELAV